MIERILYRNALFAIRLKSFTNGTIPLTDPLEPLQVLAYNRERGKYTKAHFHKTKKRVTQQLQECLVVIKGKLKINIYNSQKEFFKTLYLTAGQAVIFIRGGHAVHSVSDSEFIEIKNGPFLEDKEFIE